VGAAQTKQGQRETSDLVEGLESIMGDLGF
jgi:hypothetical protein